MDYKDINDYELVYEVREQSEEIYNVIFKKYSSLINKMAYSYFTKYRSSLIDLDDLCQEGYYALSVALKEYNQDNSLFYTFASLCIKREMERYIKSHMRYKNMILNTAISLNSYIDEQEELYLEDVIPSNYSLEENAYNNIILEKLYNYKYELDFEDSCIFELKLNRFSNKEISTLLDISYRKIDSRVNKIKGLVSNFY